MAKQEIWDRITDPTTMDVGDRVRVEVQSKDPTYGVTKIEAVVNSIGSANFWVGDPKSVDIGIPFDQSPVVEMLRPQVELPEKLGAAVLYFDPNYLEEVVLVLSHSQPQVISSPLIWLNAARGYEVTEERVEAGYIRTLHDGGN